MTFIISDVTLVILRRAAGGNSVVACAVARDTSALASLAPSGGTGVCGTLVSLAGCRGGVSGVVGILDGSAGPTVNLASACPVESTESAD